MVVSVLLCTAGLTVPYQVLCALQQLARGGCATGLRETVNVDDSQSEEELLDDGFLG